MLKHWILVFCLIAAGNLHAALFTSSDGRFGIELPTGWTFAKKPAAGSVLSIVKGSSRIDIKTVPSCHTEACIEQKTQKDLLEVKNKKMQVVGNSYTGEEIKRIDFATGEPFFYISFFTPSNDFSSGYFLVGQHAYSILAKDLSYAQTDLIFSFISPTVSATAPSTQPKNAPESMQVEVNIADKRAYTIDALPAVVEEEIAVPATSTDLAEEEPAAPQAETAVKPNVEPATKGKRKLTLITRNMPPYIQQLGHGFDVLVGLLFCYLLIQAVALGVRLFIKTKLDNAQVNPNSPYPIKFRRLYGTPSIIFRARDNQGNILLSLSSRWDSLFLFGGLMLIICAGLIMALTGILESTRLVALSAITYNTIYSAVSLVIPLGFVIFICGLLWSQLVLRQFSLYDNKGQKAVYVLQRGFGLKKECYVAYFAKSKEILLLERKRFSYLRHWQVLDKERHVLARIEEENPVFAILRKLIGHLWGMLRASYRIYGPMESNGQILNARAAFNQFSCNMDKPQAVSARNLLVAALIINIRDRDKWYPWF